MRTHVVRGWPLVRIVLTVAALLAAAAVAAACDWYVAPAGTAKANGSREAPWGISALDGKPEIRPGDTVYLVGGKYWRRPDEKFLIRLVGTQDRPIQIRPVPGERATIDGGISFQSPSAHVWLRDLEITVSEPQPAKPVGPGSHPKDFTRPWGGLHFDGGTSCKAINVIIHDCRQGISAWSPARASEIHGCIIYDNGWPAVDRGHGHAIYTQNKDDVAVISDCIMTGGHGYTMHAYGSRRAYVDNYLIEGNIAYQGGSFLIGGDRPSHNIRAHNNVLCGIALQLGYGAPFNEDCDVRDNIIVNGGLAINKYKKVVKEGNLVLASAAPRPAAPRVILRPNKYEPARANLAVFAWKKNAMVEVDPGTFLAKGDDYRLMNPRDFYGRPVLRGKYDGSALRVPVADEFAAFVLLKASPK